MDNPGKSVMALKNKGREGGRDMLMFGEFESKSAERESYIGSAYKIAAINSDKKRTILTNKGLELILNNKKINPKKKENLKFHSLFRSRFN